MPLRRSSWPRNVRLAGSQRAASRDDRRDCKDCNDRLPVFAVSAVLSGVVPCCPAGDQRLGLPSMLAITVYTSVSCPYCVQAKRLLDRKGLAYDEIDVTYDSAKRIEMIKASGRRTVPQIFIGEQPIGGFDEL